MKQLVLVHGRSQQDREPAELKKQWIDALKRGLHNISKTLPIPETFIHFPYYGDTLRDLCLGLTPAQASSVIVQGGVEDDAERLFASQMIAQIALQNPIQTITEEDADMGLDTAVVHQGAENWPITLGLLRQLDRLPGVNAQAVSLATHDVFQYLRQAGVSLIINEGVRQALVPGVETVVVAHSLGTIVCYNLLRAPNTGLRVTQLVTLGSPLAIQPIKHAMSPLGWPAALTGKWFNARDPHDVVALFPLTAGHFPLEPITDKSTVHNRPDDPHNVEDYLSDPDVARCIYDALF